MSAASASTFALSAASASTFALSASSASLVSFCVSLEKSINSFKLGSFSVKSSRNLIMSSSSIESSSKSNVGNLHASDSEPVQQFFFFDCFTFVGILFLLVDTGVVKIWLLCSLVSIGTVGFVSALIFIFNILSDNNQYSSRTMQTQESIIPRDTYPYLLKISIDLAIVISCISGMITKQDTNILFCLAKEAINPSSCFKIVEQLFCATIDVMVSTSLLLTSTRSNNRWLCVVVP